MFHPEAPLRMLSVRGTNQAENVSRSVFHHHHGSLGHMVVLKIRQFPPYDFLNSALQVGIQRGMNFPGPEGTEKGGRHVGSQRLTALFRSGTEQGFLQGAGPASLRETCLPPSFCGERGSGVPGPGPGS